MPPRHPSSVFPSGAGRSRPWSRAGGASDEHLSSDEIERAFHRERARAERTGSCFSLAVFTLDAPRDGDVERAADVVRERMRTYDQLGRLDARRLALLLPETGGVGAWRLADDVLARLGDDGLPVACEVFSHPLERAAGVGPARSAGDGAEGDPRPDGAEPAPRRPTGTDGAAPLEARADATPADLRAIHRASERPVHDLYPAFLEPLSWYRRAADVVLSGVLIALLSPLLAGAALAVRMTSRGPIVFRQWRAGRGGRPFRFYKFRSMYVDAEDRKDALRGRNEHGDAPIFKLRDDPRITPVGRFLRRTSIDELPQLFNVLKGDMTLIGPRPPTLDEVEAYEGWQKRRLDLTGGLTCIWQVSGRSEVGFEDWVRMDLEYQRRRSLWFDLRLLWRTIGAVLSGRGAY